jgi:hypothetical protein
LTYIVYPVLFGQHDKLYVLVSETVLILDADYIRETENIHEPVHFFRCKSLGHPDRDNAAVLKWSLNRQKLITGLVKSPALMNDGVAIKEHEDLVHHVL